MANSKRKRIKKALEPKDHKFYNTITRGEASLAIAIRIKKIRYNSFLVIKRVLRITAEC